MDLTTIIKAVIEIGMTAALLIIFVKYFIDRDKRRDEQLKEQSTYFLERDKQHDEKLQQQYKNFRDRENILIAESTRREEILRQESDKREKMLRQESSKREGDLLITIEGFSKTMQKISDAMEDIKGCHVKMESEIEGIKNTIERMREDGGQAGDSEGKGA